MDLTELYRPFKTATCRRCGYPIGISAKTYDTWAHIDPNDGGCGSFGSIGCRAASYERLLDNEDGPTHGRVVGPSLASRGGSRVDRGPQ